jgi:hypothetical protein
VSIRIYLKISLYVEVACPPFYGEVMLGTIFSFEMHSVDNFGDGKSIESLTLYDDVVVGIYIYKDLIICGSSRLFHNGIMLGTIFFSLEN